MSPVHVSLARGLVMLALAALMLPQEAAAERLITSLSNHRVSVSSNFVGDEVVLFGSVELDKGATPRQQPYDLVVTVIGPRNNERTRRKQRVLGIWMNVDSRAFIDVPSYLVSLSNRPVAAIADELTRRRLQLGVENTMLPQKIGPDVADVVRDDPFRKAFIRLKTERDLYLEIPNGVTFFTPTLFRATIPLPANAPIGTYEIDAELFNEGKPIARGNSALEVIKVGFEQYVATAAVNDGILYGLLTSLMALVTGWLASIVFRRD
ncbi:MAG TPA: TIGR02186 family protein [Xanthobacteraceae bacterium]|jgi:uncharacterized protein (TIGR02186 family)|nr:TIGR02186 family protein [Xanthobacteraceae bacterium]